MPTPLMERLVDEQNRIFTRMQEIQFRAENENRDWTAEERQNWDEANDRITVVSEDIVRTERLASLERIDYRQVIQPQEPDTRETPENADEARAALFEESFTRFIRGGMDNVSAEGRQLMAQNQADIRAQGVGTPSAGGYLVPPGYRAVMTEAMLAYGGLINHANVITTSTGNPLQWPTNNDTANVGAILAENVQISEQDVTIGTKSIGAYTYTSKLVRVSLQLLQDSAFNIDQWLPRKLGQRIGRAVAAHLINGTGTGEPTGILAGVTQGATATIAAFAAATTGYDAMINLEHSIDPAYRQLGNTRFIFADSTLAVIRKMKDTQNRPLWLPVPTPGMPATVNGIPYTIDQAMPAGTGTGKVVLFGDFNAGYVVRQVLDVQAVRLAERYADFLQVGFFGFMRLDATPDDALAVKSLVLT
jgi:HK97 family phage major capsid protein